MPSIATQTSYADVPDSVTQGSPRSPASATEDWRLLQCPSFEVIVNRRSGMNKQRSRSFIMRHFFSQTPGGAYTAAVWDYCSGNTSDSKTTE